MKNKIVLILLSMFITLTSCQVKDDIAPVLNQSVQYQKVKEFINAKIIQNRAISNGVSVKQMNSFSRSIASLSPPLRKANQFVYDSATIDLKNDNIYYILRMPWDASTSTLTPDPRELRMYAITDGTFTFPGLIGWYGCAPDDFVGATHVIYVSVISSSNNTTITTGSYPVLGSAFPAHQYVMITYERGSVFNWTGDANSFAWLQSMDTYLSYNNITFNGGVEDGNNVSISYSNGGVFYNIFYSPSVGSYVQYSGHGALNYKGQIKATWQLLGLWP